MQTPPTRLSAHHLERLKASLARWHANRGPNVLGSQLGQLVGEAIHPLTVKTCGGLKALSAGDLSAFIAPVAGPTSDDSHYLILVPPLEAASLESSTRKTIDEEREISGVEFWRLFANPRLTSQLAASTSGNIIAAPSEHAISPGYNLLRKLTSEDYRLLAAQFAATWSDGNARELMQASLQAPDFYNDWIAALRKSRTSELNPLKQWEITRAEHVALKLGEELVRAGVDSARAAEIVATVRPSIGSRTSRTTTQTTESAAEGGHKAPEALSRAPISNDTEWMREMLHLAIDKMPLNELLEIRVPAGLLLEIGRQRRT